MSRSPISRSPRESQEPTFTRSRSHRRPVPTPPPETPRRSSLSAEMRGMRRLEQRRNMEESHYLNCKARAQNYNPPIDLRLVDYVSPYDSNLMCPICRCPFVDPVVLTECDHCFCRDCIRQCWNTNSTYNPLGPRGNCPTCRTPAKLGSRSATSKILLNIVDDLVVKCPKSDDGCKAEVRRCEVQDHVNIYCGYALVECLGENCELPVRRKDAAQGCLHYGVSCLLCRKELQKWKLEIHWRSECPDRRVHCETCKSTVFARDLDEHSKQTCPAISIPCPGKAFGCTSRSRKGQAEIHAKSCTFAKLAPIFQKQQDRLDEQEVAQREMSRKLQVLESGFGAMRDILNPPKEDTTPDRRSAGSTRPSLSPRDMQANGTTSSFIPNAQSNFDFSDPTAYADLMVSPHQPRPSASTASRQSDPTPDVPGPRLTDLPEPFSFDSDLASPAGFPPPTTDGGPYASPLHHLLSMHESLRDEMSRISTVLSELDGRHSMQSLNENLRTREEISYMGAQVAGLQRQVHWLTSAQLQRQQGRSGTPGASSSSAMADVGAGAGVEAAVSAVSTAATALTGAARVANVGASGSGNGRDGAPMRRRASEEGRTKL
ncbi:hypothetical protein LTR37_012120 [Vermiconidia calcicola]|uniref:Uncharacterized protein n=1 Tax=Vermiconidia calcicola TaxID=1690605 RepID=A0ACC3N050_9PEZI|nr:hypothetical protein LTR37_012120 [Vermiconidia calcicola]